MDIGNRTVNEDCAKIKVHNDVPMDPTMSKTETYADSHSSVKLSKDIIQNDQDKDILNSLETSEQVYREFPSIKNDHTPPLPSIAKPKTHHLFQQLLPYRQKIE